jgi:hypothetical protein
MRKKGKDSILRTEARIEQASCCNNKIAYEVQVRTTAMGLVISSNKLPYVESNLLMSERKSDRNEIHDPSPN